jgi:hypothetical protein
MTSIWIVFKCKITIMTAVNYHEKLRAKFEAVSETIFDDAKS